jgi:hypothetical protein
MKRKDLEEGRATVRQGLLAHLAALRERDGKDNYMPYLIQFLLYMKLAHPEKRATFRSEDVCVCKFTMCLCFHCMFPRPDTVAQGPL